MKQKGFHRKLTAILSADVAGYSRLMQDDEAATVKTLDPIGYEYLGNSFFRRLLGKPRKKAVRQCPTRRRVINVQAH